MVMDGDTVTAASTVAASISQCHHRIGATDINRATAASDGVNRLFTTRHTLTITPQRFVGTEITSTFSRDTTTCIVAVTGITRVRQSSRPAQLARLSGVFRSVVPTMNVGGRMRHRIEMRCCVWNCV